MSTQLAQVTALNPFGGGHEQGIAPVQPGAITQIEQQRAMTEAQGMIAMAKRFPRDQRAAMDNILNACARPSLAEKALYVYNRGGTEISGPSIRLAEALAQNWGNMQYGIRELDQRPGVSTVEAFAWDMETNSRQTKVFQVEHKRYTKRGTYKLEDPRDIYELIANNGARRLRACILGLIPGDVVDAAVQQCDDTLSTSSEVTTESVKKMVDAFAGFDVTVEMLEKFLQRRIDTMQPSQMSRLRKIYASLKDGMSKAESWFEVDVETGEAPPAATKSESIKNKLKNQAGQPTEGTSGPIESAGEPATPPPVEEASA